MNKIFNTASIFIGAAGGALTYLFGDFDTVLWALIIIMILDYITGVIKAVYKKELSSETGYGGLLKKITVLAVVVLANVLGQLSGISAMREMVIMFYAANEGISVLENVAEVSDKIPRQLKDVLLQLRDEQK